MNKILAQIKDQQEKIKLLKSRINSLQRQDNKSVSRVGKLDKAKSTVILNKINRDEVKLKRKELEVHKLIEVEVKKVKVV